MKQGLSIITVTMGTHNLPHNTKPHHIITEFPKSPLGEDQVRTLCDAIVIPQPKIDKPKLQSC